MAGEQPHLHIGLRGEAPAPLAEVSLPLERLTNDEIRRLGRMLVSEFYDDRDDGDPRLDGRDDPAVDSLLFRFDESLRALGRDDPLRAVELIDEVADDPVADGYDILVAATAGGGLSYADPLGAAEWLRRLLPRAEYLHGRHDSSPEFSRFTSLDYVCMARDELFELDKRFPGAVE